MQIGRALLTAAPLLGFLCCPAAATPLLYDIVVDVSDGPLAGQTLSGSMVLDGGILVHLDLQVGPVHFDETNSGAQDVLFNGGVLSNFIIGGDVSGVAGIGAGTNDFLLVGLNSFR